MDTAKKRRCGIDSKGSRQAETARVDWSELFSGLGKDCSREGATKKELSDATGMTLSAISVRIHAGIKAGRVRAARGIRPDVLGIMRTVPVYLMVGK